MKYSEMKCAIELHSGLYLSNPKPRHTMGGSARGARQGCGGRAGRDANRTVRQASLVTSKASKKCRLNASPEARTSEIQFKPMDEQNPRLITGLSVRREALFLPGC